MITVEGLSAGYGRTPVLHNIDLTVDRGSVVALLGRNGVGKTTLLKALIGEVPATSGTVRFDGRDVTRLRTHQRSRLGVAYVPQGREIFSDLSVLDNLRVAAYAAHKEGWQPVLKDVLAEFPILAEKQAQPGGSLSGGQQQILALGRALMTQPDVLLLDEPSEGIQPSIVQQIGGVVADINRRRGITVVLVEQNLEFASMVASEAYVMDKGEVVRQMRTADLLADKAMQHELLGV